MEEQTKGMHILRHLEELRWTIFKVLLSLIPGVIIGFLLLDEVHYLITSTVPEGVTLRFKSPVEPLIIQLKMAFYVGIIIAFPAIFYFIWNFISPGLKKKEKKIAFFIISTGTLLFLSGLFLAYNALQFIAQALVDYGIKDILNIWDYSLYINFMVSMILAFGLIFEMPLIVMALVKLQIVSVKTLKKNRGYTLILGAILSAILTPPDPYSMVMLLIPLMFLYEIGIIAGSVIEKRINKKRKLQKEVEHQEDTILAEIEAKNTTEENIKKSSSSEKIQEDFYADQDAEFFKTHDSDADYGLNDEYYTTDFDDNDEDFLVNEKPIKKGKMELEKLPDLFKKSVFSNNKNNEKSFFD